MFPLETIVARAKRRAFVYPGSDIYGGLANAWDYGPYGVQLKKNIQDAWRKTFVQERPDMVGLDAQILMHPKVWDASGHTANFNDPLIDDKNTGERFRADKIIEEKIGEMRLEIGKKMEKEKFKIRRGEKIDPLYDDDTLLSISFSCSSEVKDQVASAGYFKIYSSEEQNNGQYNMEVLCLSSSENLFSQSFDINSKKISGYGSFNNLKDPTSGNHKYYKYFIELLIMRYLRDKELEVSNLIPESWTFEQMKAFIVEFIPNNPNTGKPADWTDVRKFAMMFSTHQGVIEDEENKIRLRPETAQGIFVNFKNILDTTRMRIPFGIAQVGKSFRNEITPGNFLYRTREFEQMEIEYFVEHDEEVARTSFEERQKLSMQFWLETLHIQQAHLRFREHEKDELSHYSKGTFDVEFQYPWGRGELQGIAWRGDFDLSQHQEFSGKNMQYTDPYTGKRYIPHVIEPSFGLSRAVLAVMFDAYDEEQYTDGNGNEQTRVVSRFSPNIAPIKFAILPLIKKDKNQVAIAQDLFVKLSKQFMCEYDDGGAIGKRYRRQDEIGTPYCITIDHQSVEDGTVTLRERDGMGQKRVKIEDLESVDDLEGLENM